MANHSLSERLSAQTHAVRLLSRIFAEQPSARMARVRAEWIERLNETAGELADRLAQEYDDARQNRA